MKKWYQWSLIWYGIFFVLALWIIFGLGREYDAATNTTKTTFSPKGITQFRKGMDIAGWVKLTYKIDFSKYDQIYTKITERDAAKKQAIAIILNNIDKRISALGVSDYSARQQNINNDTFLVVEIWWVYSIDAAKNIIGKTVELEFKVPVEKDQQEKYTLEREKMKTELFNAIKKSPQDITNLVSGKEGDDVYVRSLQDSDIDTLPIIYNTNKQKITSSTSWSIIDLWLWVYAKTNTQSWTESIEWYTLILVNGIKNITNSSITANKFVAVAEKLNKKYSILTGTIHNTTTGSIEYDAAKKQLLLNSDIDATQFGSSIAWYQVIAIDNVDPTEEKLLRESLQKSTLINGIEVFVNKTPQWIVAVNPQTNEILNWAFFSYAAPSVNQIGKSVVTINFNEKGKEIFCNLTKAYTNKQMAIFVAGQLMTAPTINEPICGGSAQIDGSFTSASAKELAEWLNEGALPAPLILANEEKVSAALGDGAIQGAMIATAVGLIMILAFLLRSYGRKLWLIWFAVLISYLVYMLAAFKIIDYAFSLAGIAAIVLSLGMGIDANILIFERLREELNTWKSFSNAVDTAYTRSREAIRDGNVTTIIIFLVLFGMGMSIFKWFGFAGLISWWLILSVNVPLTKALLKLIKKQ
jgi:protein-export membrane protein SecD